LYDIQIAYQTTIIYVCPARQEKKTEENSLWCQRTDS